MRARLGESGSTDLEDPAATFLRVPILARGKVGVGVEHLLSTSFTHYLLLVYGSAGEQAVSDSVPPDEL